MLLDRAALRDTYNRIADDWLTDHQQDDWSQGGSDAFASLLAPGALVLDGGCGPGIKSAYLLRRGLRVVGIDFAPRMIEIAREQAPSGDFRVLDLSEIHHLSETFDGIYLQAALLHIPRQEVPGILDACTAKLHPGGVLYIAVKEKKVDRPDEEIRQEDDYGSPYERFFSYFTADELKAGLVERGYQIRYETIHQAGKTRWIQLIGQRIG